jgi:hypothetical protein
MWVSHVNLFKETATSRQQLFDGSPVDVGDKLHLEFDSNRASHVYVFNTDSDGKKSVLFPVTGVEPHNPLPSGSVVRLPGQVGSKAVDWTVDADASDSEEVVILATAQSDKSIEDAIADWARPSLAMNTSPPLRGMGQLEFAARDPAIASAELKQVIDGAMASDKDAKLWRIHLRHSTDHAQ